MRVSSTSCKMRSLFGRAATLCSPRSPCLGATSPFVVPFCDMLTRAALIAVNDAHRSWGLVGELVDSTAYVALHAVHVNQLRKGLVDVYDDQLVNLVGVAFRVRCLSNTCQRSARV